MEEAKKESPSAVLAKQKCTSKLCPPKKKIPSSISEVEQVPPDLRYYVEIRSRVRGFSCVLVHPSSPRAESRNLIGWCFSLPELIYFLFGFFSFHFLLYRVCVLLQKLFRLDFEKSVGFPAKSVHSGGEQAETNLESRVV